MKKSLIASIVGYVFVGVALILGITFSLFLTGYEVDTTTQKLELNCPPPSVAYKGGFDKYLCQGLAFGEAGDYYPSLTDLGVTEEYSNTGVVIGGGIIGKTPATASSSNLKVLLSFNKVPSSQLVWAFKLDSGIIKGADEENNEGEGGNTNDVKPISDEDIEYYESRTWNQLIDCTKLNSDDKCEIDLGAVYSTKATETYHNLTIILFDNGNTLPVGFDEDTFPINVEFQTEYSTDIIDYERTRFAMSSLLLICIVSAGFLASHKKMKSNPITAGISWVIILGILCPMSYVKQIIWLSSANDEIIPSNGKPSGIASGALDLATNFCEVAGDAFVLSLCIWYCANSLWVCLGGYDPKNTQRPRLLMKCSPRQCIIISTVLGFIYLITSSFAIASLSGKISRILGIVMSSLSIALSLIALIISWCYTILWGKYSKGPGVGILQINGNENDSDTKGMLETKTSTDNERSPHSDSTTALSDNTADEYRNKNNSYSSVIKRGSNIHTQIITIILSLCVLVHSTRYFSIPILSSAQMFAMISMPIIAGVLSILEEILCGGSI